MLLDLNALQKVLEDVMIIGKSKETGKSIMFTLDKFIEYFETKQGTPSESK